MMIAAKRRVGSSGRRISGEPDDENEVSRTPDAIDVAAPSRRLTVHLLPSPKRVLPILSVVCALTCLPFADMQWARSPESVEDGPVHFGATRRSLPVALWSRGSTSLRDLFRSAERWRAGFVSLSSQRNKPAKARTTAQRVRDGRMLAVARCSLARRSSDRSSDDSPA
jgi:hypothetical protein